MAVKGLEDALETVLFERSRHGLAPTPAGERLYPRACSPLAQSTAMVRDFRDTPRALSCRDDVPCTLQRPLLPLFDQHLPGTSPAAHGVHGRGATGLGRKLQARSRRFCSTVAQNRM